MTFNSYLFCNISLHGLFTACQILSFTADTQINVWNCCECLLGGLFSFPLAMGSKPRETRWCPITPKYQLTNRFQRIVCIHVYGYDCSISLLVGAPKAQTSQPNVTAGGAVYRCGLESTTICAPVPFDLTGPTPSDIGRGQYKDDKSHQWFGATVEASGENGLVVACAPRYVSFSINYQRREPVGTCWIAKNSFSTFDEYSPCRTSMINIIQLMTEKWRAQLEGRGQRFESTSHSLLAR
ncbi:integrin alpha-5, partial [Caerostris extrusa]